MMEGVIHKGMRAQDVVFLERVGSGADAEVWKVQELAPPKRVIAAKVVAIRYCDRTDRINAEKIRRIQEEELANWGKFETCPFVMPLYGPINDMVDVEEEKYMIVGCKMPLANLGDLGKYLDANDLKLQGRKELRRFLLNIARGVKAAHDVNVAHCDIKASNILLFQEGAEVVPRIVDFGIAIGVEMAIRKGGTPEYMAPEQFREGASITLDEAKQADIYSLGILFYQIICQRLPFVIPWRTKEERWSGYQYAHSHDEPDYELITEASDEQLKDLVAHMLKKLPAKRLPTYRVIRELERQELDSIVMTWTAREIPDVVTPSTYRWNIRVHEILGNELHYCLVRGRELRSDTEWFRNNLCERKIHGYSFYRVLGDYDYLIRVWLKAPYVTLMNRLLEEFAKTKGGHNISFAVKYVGLFESPKRLVFEDRNKLLESIAKCSNKDNPEEEFVALKKAKLVTSKLGSARPKDIRFFVVVNTADRVSDHYCEVLAKDFQSKLLSKGLGLREMSVYSGTGDFVILIKFRLNRFLRYKDVVFALADLTSAARMEALLTFHTFVEMDELGFIESDDGSIIKEASIYADKEL